MGAHCAGGVRWRGMAHVCAHACLVCTYCPRQLLCRSSCSNALGPTFAAARTAPCVRALRNRTRAPKACQESGGHSWPSAQCRSRDREPLTLRRAFVFVSSSSVKARWASSCCVKVLELRGSSGSWRISHDVGRHLHEQSSGGRTWFFVSGHSQLAPRLCNAILSSLTAVFTSSKLSAEMAHLACFCAASTDSSSVLYPPVGGALEFEKCCAGGTWATGAGAEGVYRG